MSPPSRRQSSRRRTNKPTSKPRSRRQQKTQKKTQTSELNLKPVYTLLGVLLTAISGVSLYEMSLSIIRQRDRVRIYKLAKKRVAETKRRLIVYGDPYNGHGSRFYNQFMKTYGCGDICVDLSGCPKCEHGVKSDMLEHLKTLKSNSAVIFTSCVLELIPQVEETIREIKRVAGSLDNIFVVTVDSRSLMAYIYKDVGHGSLNLIQGPPDQKDLTFRRLWK